jgi:septation ring formation regulator
MDNVFKILSDIRVIIAIAVLVVLIIIWFIIQRVKSGNYKKQLEAYEVRYNAIKSVPLSFKMNKAVAISRVDPEAMSQVQRSKDQFSAAEANLKQISTLLSDTEDDILVGKLKKAKSSLQELDASISLGEKQVSELEKFLDGLLEKETAQRQEVNGLKNDFRELKQEAQENSNQLAYAWNSIQKRFSEIEKMFSAFEEWMYASDFEKASSELTNIKNSIDGLRTVIKDLPDLLTEARGVIPNMAENLHHDYMDCRKRGVYLQHLEITNNLAIITDGLKKDLGNLKNCDATDVKEHLEDYKKRLEQMDEAVKKEDESYSQLKTIAEGVDSLYSQSFDNLQYVKKQYETLSTRFGLGNLKEEIDDEEKKLSEIELKKKALGDLLQNSETAASKSLNELQEVERSLNEVSTSLTATRESIDNVCGDEDRARKQLVKLQVIMNQLQVSIRKYKLPSISTQYEEDMNKANEYIHRIESLLEETPLNVQLLNSTLKEAIDFIYKLYNNVNNVVGAVMMVENTIVFGNRYRSTYSDIDSELTRSELCFRNGEYTQALTIAIATIEKIHPGNYEKMVKENARAAGE